MLYMHRALQRSVTQGEMEKTMLQQQLGREYGETWERVLKADKAGKPPRNPGKVSRQKTDNALGCLKRLGRFGAVLKDYVPGRGQSAQIVNSSIYVILGHVIFAGLLFPTNLGI